MKFVKLLVVSLITALGTIAASAQPFPTKPIKIIVSSTPGGATDIMARILGHYITARTGQPHVIDNRSGASGNIAMEAVAKAAPDGYTLGFANTGNITINPYLFKSMPFDPLNDLIPVGPVGTVPLFLVINGRLPAKTLAEFIAYAKADIVERLNTYTRAVQEDPEAKKRLEASFIDPLPLAQGEFAAMVKADAVKYERIVREAGIRLD